MNDNFSIGLMAGALFTLIITIFLFITLLYQPLETRVKSGKEFKLYNYKYLCKKTKEIKTVEVELHE